MSLVVRKFNGILHQNFTIKAYFCTMKRISYLLLFVLIIIGFSNCSNDFELTTGDTNKPVVYGFLSPKDTTTYIRVEKAFVSENTSALELAQRPDELYYEDIDVTISSGSNSYSLTRVDGAAEGYPRDAGVFANDPNYLYKLVLPAGETYEGGDEYQLSITDAAADTILTEVTTTIVHEPTITFPDQDDEFRWRSSIESQNDIRTEWRFNNNTAGVFDVRIRFFYQEAIDGDLNNRVNKSVVFTVLKNIEPDDEDDTSILIEVLSTDILASVGAMVDASGPGPRFFTTMEMVVDAGSKDLIDFISVGQANKGLTGASVPPIFSNIPGGFGLFSSRNSASVGGLRLIDQARDSLMNGRFTGQLNFQ